MPDGGSGAIWFDHKDSSNPFLSIYLACDHAPYENVYKPNLPYARDAVIEAIRQIITNFHPAMIALTGPDERHVDHRTANWFAIKACQALLKQKALDPQTIVLADQVYGAGGFKPAPYKYENFVVHLSGEAAALKQEMTWIYQSQDGNLAEGDKKTLAELPREEKHLRIMDWQEHEGWNERQELRQALPDLDLIHRVSWRTVHCRFAPLLAVDTPRIARYRCKQLRLEGQSSHG